MGLKENAQGYFDRIPFGHKNAIQRPWDNSTDRELRRMIESANNNGDCIINVGKGYFRPMPGDEVDEGMLKRYLAKELSRARSIQIKRLSMKQAYEGWKHESMLRIPKNVSENDDI